MSAETIPVERQRLILNMVDEHGVIRVSDLSDQFDVSVMTIRRDLMVLEERGLISRSHGGAISKRRFQHELYFEQKGERNQREKSAIGEVAARMLEPGETVFVNSGSTTLELLRRIPDMELRVVTSNAGVLSVLSGAQVEYLVIGGVYRPRSNSFVGGFALQALSQIHGGRCFIGVDGLSLDAGLTTPHHQEAEVGRQMIRQTRGEVIVLADSSKIGGVAPFVTAPLELVDVLITDSAVSEEYVAALEEHGITVRIASAG